MSEFDTEAAELLEKAADLLETDGWGQGNYVLPDGTMCSMGALMRAYNGKEDVSGYRIDSVLHEPAMTKAREELAARLPSGPRTDPFGTVVNWNDEEGRTADQVIELFKQTAKDLRNRATPA